MLISDWIKNVVRVFSSQSLTYLRIRLLNSVAATMINVDCAASIFAFHRSTNGYVYKERKECDSFISLKKEWLIVFLNWSCRLQFRATYQVVPFSPTLYNARRVGNRNMIVECFFFLRYFCWSSVWRTMGVIARESCLLLCYNSTTRNTFEVNYKNERLGLLLFRRSLDGEILSNKEQNQFFWACSEWAPAENHCLNENRWSATWFRSMLFKVFYGGSLID